MATVPGCLAVQEKIDATAKRVVSPDALQAGAKGLSSDDAAAFRAEVEAEFGAPLAKDVAEIVSRFTQSATTLDQARGKWNAAKKMFRPFDSKGPADSGGESLRRWLLDGDKFTSAVKCVRMERFADARSTDTSGYILWTGGAADCIAIATYDANSGFAWLTHATAISTSDPKDLMLEINPGGKNKSLKIYLSSTKPQPKVEQALQAKGWPYTLWTTGKLAINARTGEVLSAFDIKGLPTK